MEGVLVPEIWIAFAEATGIEELRTLRATSRITTSSCAVQHSVSCANTVWESQQIQDTLSAKIDTDAGRKGVSGRGCAAWHAGRHPQRHVRTVRTASDEKAGLADTVLQHAGNRRRRHDLKAQNALREIQVHYTSKRCSPADSKPSPAATATTISA